MKGTARLARREIDAPGLSGNKHDLPLGGLLAGKEDVRQRAGIFDRLRGARVGDLTRELV